MDTSDRTHDNIETRAFPVSLTYRAAADGVKAGLTGYGLRWSETATIESVFGSFRERFERGAFRESLKENSDVRLLIGHDQRRLPLARGKNGSLRVSEDAEGLRFEADLDDRDPESAALMFRVREGLVDGMSIGFTMGSKSKEEVIRGDRAKGELDTYVIKRVGGLHEISAVTFPAYESSDVSARRRGLTAPRAPEGDADAAAADGGDDVITPDDDAEPISDVDEATRKAVNALLERRYATIQTHYSARHAEKEGQR